ncbi:MAG: B12-binding domain-containing radical SAM protein [Candidatus Lokiarchaeota archaeon]|nr:B12-binding domain-containing radical SAM protein [Candidatus Lokiarchaeota archaeon]
MIDVLLINPRTEASSVQNYDREPPTGLMILAAILDKQGYLVEIMDCSVVQNAFEYLRSNAINFRMIGLTCLTNTYYQAVQLAKTAKRYNPSSYIIMGGAHVSFQYEEAFEDMPFLDAICIGESEISFPYLVNLFLGQSSYEFLYDQSEISETKNDPGKSRKLLNTATDLPKGIIYPSSVKLDSFTKAILGIEVYDGSSQKTSLSIYQFPDPVNIKKVPLPARHLINAYHVADVIINRGCPNNCSFCSRTKLFPTVRIREISDIMAELDHILSIPSYQFVNFYDNINLSTSFFHDFLDALIERRFRLPWGAELRADKLVERQVDKMNQSNCKIIATGVESAAPEVLQLNVKNQDPQKVAEGIKLLKKYGIAVQAYFVVGLPGETTETFEKTLDYIRELPLQEEIDKIEFFPATPYPGSDLFTKRKDFGLKILTKNYNMYNCKEIIMETKTLSYKEISIMMDSAKSLKKRLNL